MSSKATVRGKVVTDESKPTTIAVSQRTKAALDSIKHPGQSYDGMIQELIELWKKEHRVAESVSTTQD